jgi:deazaflavin-dependent oxidoreductase (nitroreductase family)
MATEALRAKPRGLLRLFFRMPVWLFRLGLGGFMPWWVLLTTVGRKSGKLHRTVVDIVQRDGDAVYLIAAYGYRADWVRNLEANGVLKAQIGWRKFDARAAFLPREHAGNLLVDFYRRRPGYTRAVMRSVGVEIRDENDVRAGAAKMLVVRVDKV